MRFRTVSFRISEELYRQILEISHKKMMSMSDVIRQAIIELLEREKKR